MFLVLFICVFSSERKYHESSSKGVVGHSCHVHSLHFRILVSDIIQGWCRACVSCQNLLHGFLQGKGHFHRLLSMNSEASCSFLFIYHLIKYTVFFFYYKSLLFRAPVVGLFVCKLNIFFCLGIWPISLFCIYAIYWSQAWVCTPVLFRFIH